MTIKCVNIQHDVYFLPQTIKKFGSIQGNIWSSLLRFVFGTQSTEKNSTPAYPLNYYP